MSNEECNPRKSGLNIDLIQDDKKREIAKIVKQFLDANHLTIRRFAEIEPSISLSTANNLMSPTYGSAPTPKILRKIARKIANESQDVNAEDIYREMLKIIDETEEKYPFNEEAKNVDGPKITESEIRNLLMEKISSLLLENNLSASYKAESSIRAQRLKKIFKGKDTENIFYPNIKHDFVATIKGPAELPIDTWLFNITQDTVFLGQRLPNLFYNVMIDATEKTKFSIITTKESIYEELIARLKLGFSAFNAYVSVILIGEDTFKETYIDTAKDRKDLDEVGLSINP